MKKLAVITTHPIQYYAPVFELLSHREKCRIKVFYTAGSPSAVKLDRGFGKVIQWDIPLLNGYEHLFLANSSRDPGSHHFKGAINPTLIKDVTYWHPDAILVIGWSYQSHLKAIRYFKHKIPIYFRGDSTLLNERGGLRSLLKTFFLRNVYNGVDTAFYVGTFNRAYFEKYGLKNNHLEFAPHAVDNDRFSKDQNGPALEFRRSLGLTDGDILVLYAGKFEYVKNLDLLIDAFNGIQKQNVHLLFTGNGNKETLLKDMAERSQYRHRIHFSDFRNQSFMPVLYQAADLFCLPSLSETWGLAVNEAMASGKAVIVSDKVGCSIDLVKDGFNGAIFHSGDVIDLQRKLEALVSSKSKLAEMGKNSRYIIAGWTFLEIAKKIENKINEAC